MKHWQDYKKQFQYSFSAILGIVFLAFFAVSFAQTAEEIKNKIDSKSADIAKLEQEIRSYQAQLDGISKQKSSLSNTIKELDLTRKKLVANISVTENKIEKTNLKIQSLGSQIVSKEGSISNNTKSIMTGLQVINEFENTSLIENIISEKNFTSIWNNLDSIITVNEKVKEKIIELKQVKGELEDSRSETLEAKAELIKLKNELADEKKIVDQNTAQKNKLLKETKNNEASYQKLVKDRLAQKIALEQELRNYESQLKFILDPSTLPNGGVLSWPLDNVFVTQLFGKTVAAKRLYASGSHSGVDFRASVGTPVKAMSDGVVMGFGDTDTTCPGASFGKWVLIQYNNGLSSAYGHLSLSKVYEGQKVSRGEIVAYSGNTGHTTGPHLHVTVYASSAVKVQTLPSKSCSGKTLTQPIAAVNAYLDPMYYLSKL